MIEQEADITWKEVADLIDKICEPNRKLLEELAKH